MPGSKGEKRENLVFQYSEKLAQEINLFLKFYNHHVFVLFCHLLSGTARCFWIILYTYCTVLESATSSRSPGSFYWSSLRNQDLGMTTDFSATIIETRRQWNIIFTRLRKITISRIEFVFLGWWQSKDISRKNKTWISKQQTLAKGTAKGNILEDKWSLKEVGAGWNDYENDNLWVNLNKHFLIK